MPPTLWYVAFTLAAACGCGTTPHGPPEGPRASDAAGATTPTTAPAPTLAPEPSTSAAAPPPRVLAPGAQAAASSSRLIPSPVFGQCVHHSGGGGVKRSGRATVRMNGQTSRSEGGAIVEADCYADAECVAHPGHGGPGDGFVRLRCGLAACTCTAEPIGAGQAAASFEFAIDSACENSATTGRLLAERCVAWVPPTSSGWPKK